MSASRAKVWQCQRNSRNLFILTDLSELAKVTDAFRYPWKYNVSKLLAFATFIVVVSSLSAFSPHPDLFLPISLSLPERDACSLFTQSSFLIVHSRNYISKFTVGQGGQLVQCSTQTETYKGTNSQPVVVPVRGLFFVFQKCMCVCFDVETGEQVQSFS